MVGYFEADSGSLTWNDSPYTTQTVSQFGERKERKYFDQIVSQIETFMYKKSFDINVTDISENHRNSEENIILPKVFSEQFHSVLASNKIFMEVFFFNFIDFILF